LELVATPADLDLPQILLDHLHLHLPLVVVPPSERLHPPRLVHLLLLLEQLLVALAARVPARLAVALRLGRIQHRPHRDLVVLVPAIRKTLRSGHRALHLDCLVAAQRLLPVLEVRVKLRVSGVCESAFLYSVTIPLFLFSQQQRLFRLHCLPALHQHLHPEEAYSVPPQTTIRLVALVDLAGRQVLLGPRHPRLGPQLKRLVCLALHLLRLRLEQLLRHHLLERLLSRRLEETQLQPHSAAQLLPREDCLARHRGDLHQEAQKCNRFSPQVDKTVPPQLPCNLFRLWEPMKTNPLKN